LEEKSSHSLPSTGIHSGLRWEIIFTGGMLQMMHHPLQIKILFFRYKVYFFVNVMIVINTNKKEIIKFGDTILIRSFYHIPEVYYTS